MSSVESENARLRKELSDARVRIAGLEEKMGFEQDATDYANHQADELKRQNAELKARVRELERLKFHRQGASYQLPKRNPCE